MVYIGLDLDNTLGDFESLFPFFPDINNDPASFKIDKRNENYWEIVKIIGNRESGNDEENKPFGLFNPVMLNELQKIKETNKINSIVIYSNNGSEDCIRFVADVLGYIYKDKNFIFNIAGRSNPARLLFDYPKKTTLNTIKADILNPSKTVNFLKILFKIKNPQNKLSPLKVPNINNKYIYFYDDQIHADLRNNLEKNYILIDPPFINEVTTPMIYEYLIDKLNRPTPRTTRRKTLRTITRKKSSSKKTTPRVS